MWKKNTRFYVECNLWCAFSYVDTYVHFFTGFEFKYVKSHIRLFKGQMALDRCVGGETLLSSVKNLLKNDWAHKD